MKTGTATFPCTPKSPRLALPENERLAREMVLVIVDEFGTEELLRKLSDPFWFQAFAACWDSTGIRAGLTTTVCGALKEGAKGIEHETGFFVAGGKGKVSRKTPDEILAQADRIDTDPESLVYASKMSAKVDSAAVQDGYQLYHHAFFFNREGRWAVVQQGMNTDNAFARRYHWLGREDLDFTSDPHKAVCCNLRGSVLNLVAAEGGENRDASTRLASEKTDLVLKEAEKITSLELPARHRVMAGEINPDYLSRILLKTYESQPPTLNRF